ncbi:acyl-CoA thioesterase [Dongshaea marina]|uniref:acyl-CoA thioesterase n=1 Tax=Dongshaea marina TaxID=2047966 RepID=UPI000D3E75BA|nr:thioesterase family protein [Dongshaea marina]
MQLPGSELELTIPFYDVDSMGVVWHGNYLKYFERVRGQLLEQIGLGYASMANSDYVWPIIDIRVKYVRPCRVDQRIRLTAQMQEYENRIRISYRIEDSLSGEKLTTGYSVQVAVIQQTGEMLLASPDFLLKKMEKFQCA